jgi:hypothetical protein
VRQPRKCAIEQSRHSCAFVASAACFTVRVRDARCPSVRTTQPPGPALPLRHPVHPLPLHLVGLVAPPQAEGRGQVACELVDLLDVCDESLVDGLLGLDASAANLLLLRLLALLEESGLASLLLGLLCREEIRLGNFVELLRVEAVEVDLERGGDDVARVDSPEGDTVDLEGAGDEEDTLVECLDEDDALAAEATGQEDQNGAGLEGLARGPGADRLANL